MSSKLSPSLSGLKIDPAALAKLEPAERERVAEELRVVEEAFKRNPLLGFEPHSKQVDFLIPELDGSWPFLRAFFGGNRSGKTTAAILYVLIQVCPDELLPPHLKKYKRWDGPVRVRVVTPDLTSTLDGVIHEKIREWCPPELLKGGNFDRAFDKVQRILRFKRGDWIQFNSSEQDREKLGGVALHIVVYDEEPREEVRGECLMRLVDFDGEEIFALTPFSGMKWLYDEIYEPWERGVLPSGERVVVVDMDDNPHLSEAGKQRVLSKYSGPSREARKSGRFVSFAGLIYPQFRTDGDDSHVIPQLERVPPGVEVFRGVDPGYRHLCAVLYCYLDSDDEMVVFDEIGLQGATVKQVCDQMERTNLKWGAVLDDGTRLPLRPAWSVIDPAARNKNNQTGRSDQQEFYDNGVSTIPGQNAVSAGINRVKERLDAGKLKVCANCEGLLGEFKRYRWVMETGRGENEAREAPVKRDDHRLDALRYIVMQRPLVPLERVPAESLSQRERLLRHHLRRFHGKPKYDSGFGPGVFQ